MSISRATKRKLAVLLVALLCVGAVGGLYLFQKHRQRERLAADKRDGMAAYQSGEYAEALPRLSRYVGRHKDDADVLLAFADSLQRVPTEGDMRGRRQQALGATQLALELDPASERAWVMRMEIAASLGYITEANEAAARVLEQNPANLTAHAVRLESAIATGRDSDRIDAALRLAEVLPESLDAQWTALNHLLAAGLAPERLDAFVDASTAALGDRMGSLLIQARVAIHQHQSDAPGTEGREHEERFASLLATAVTIPPQEPLEAILLVSFLDGAVSAATRFDQTANGLLMDYLDSPEIRPGILEFAAARAWQRGNTDLLDAIASGDDDPATLSTATLGWLALANRVSDTYAAALASREADALAAAWLSIHEASELVQSGQFAAARETLASVRNSDNPTIRELDVYLDSLALDGLGERSMADARLTELEPRPDWSRARLVLGEWAVEREDYWRAYQLLRRDQLIMGLPLLMEAAVRLEETDFRWPVGAITGRQLSDSFLMVAPEQPVALSYHARAELAAGNVDRARDVADQLMSAPTDGDAEAILRFAARLETVDAERAQKLRDRFAQRSNEAMQTLVDRALSGQIGVEEFKDGVKSLVAEGAPEAQLQGEVLIANVLDTLNDPGAAQAFSDLAQKHPSDARVQIEALRSNAIWNTPAEAEGVIGRLRSLTGDDGTSWRVFEAKRLLLTDQSEATAARVVNDLSSVLRVSPGDVLALQLMAEAMIRVGDLPRSASFATRAADAAPENLIIAMDAVDALVRAGLNAEAEARLQASVTIQSDSVGARLRRVSLLGRYGLRDAAVEDWLWLSTQGDALTRARSALALAQLDRADLATELIAELRSDDQLSPEARTLLADALAVLGRKPEGEALLRAAASGVGGEAPEVAVAAFLARHARTPEDFQALEQFARETDLAETWATAVRGYMSQGLIVEARHVLEEAKNSIGDDPAFAVYDSALDPERGTDGESYFAIARASLAAIDADWARDLSDLLTRRINDSGFNAQLITHLRELVKRQPQTVLVWTLLAESQFLGGDRAGARTTLQRMLQTIPTNPQAAQSAVFMFGRLRFADDGLLAAREYQDRLTEPTYQSGRLLAETALAAGRGEEAWAAISPWKESLATPVDRGLFVRAAVDAGAVAEAAEVVWSVDKEDRAWTRDAIVLGERIADLDARRAWLEAAAERVAPEDDRLRLTLATAWYTLALDAGDLNGLDHVMELASREATDELTQARLLRLRGSCLSLLGRSEDAIAAYRGAAELDPDDPDTLNNLAYLLLEGEGNEQEALGLIEHAVGVLREAGAPANQLVAYLDTLGTALLRTGEAERAVVIFREALTANPGYEYALVGMAEAQLAVGNPDEARSVLRRVQTANPALAERLARVRAALEG
ncbi:MAG: tetratricopeptide repeat protein [Phycisphaerales bacterium JB054]